MSTAIHLFYSGKQTGEQEEDGEEQAQREGIGKAVEVGTCNEVLQELESQKVGRAPVKRQFVRIRCVEDYPGQIPDGWQRVNMQGESANEVAQSPHPQTGLLSGWRMSNGNSSLGSFEAVAARNAEAPVATRGHETDPTFGPAQGFAPGQISSYESGVRPLASLFVDPPGQGLPNSQPLPPGSVEPFPKPPIWSPMPISSQSGPPPAMQPGGLRAAPSPVTPPPVGKRQQKSTSKKRRFPIWARVIVSILLVLLILSGVGIGYYQVNFASHISNITGQPAAPITPKEDGGTSQTSTTTTNNLGSQRINILLLGSDNDEKFLNGAPLAQTDIVVTIDPTTKYVGMLSIPRDLWINVPGFGSHKLDEAFSYGWQYVHVVPTPLPNAVGLSIATIEQDFGITINHYAWVGLDGFIKVINTADGVDIDAIHPMTDDIYPNDINTKDPYGYKRLYIAPGPQHMDGIHALEYVRTRHSDLVGDFGRSARQQQVLSQLKTKLATPGIINKLPELTKDLDGFVKTDMDLSGVISLMGFARNLDPNKVDRLVLGPPYSAAFTTSGGAYALRPNCSLIMPKIAKMFDLGDRARCGAVTNSNESSSQAFASSTPFAPDQGTNALLSLGERTPVSITSLLPGNSEVFGVHSLLDLLFLIVFESFEAVKVWTVP